MNSKIKELEAKVNTELAKHNRILKEGSFEIWYNEQVESYRKEMLDETDSLVNSLLKAVGQDIGQKQEKFELKVSEADALSLLQKIDQEVI